MQSAVCTAYVSRYDNARLNTGDYVLVMLSNDASEFGLRFVKEF
jgi:iron complex outermembrane recepter protein